MTTVLLKQGVLLLVVVVMTGSGNQLIGEEAKKTVKIAIQYGDGSERHFTAIPWKKEMTVLDAMKHAQAHPRGIKFEFKGKNATAFLTKIDDLKNEGRGRNWLFHINGKQADRSFGVFELKAGDTVLWKFDKYR